MCNCRCFQQRYARRRVGLTAGPVPVSVLWQIVQAESGGVAQLLCPAPVPACLRVSGAGAARARVLLFLGIISSRSTLGLLILLPCPQAFVPALSLGSCPQPRFLSSSSGSCPHPPGPCCICWVRGSTALQSMRICAFAGLGWSTMSSSRERKRDLPDLESCS